MIGTCPRDGCAVVELAAHPGYVACVSCGTDWPEAEFTNRQERLFA